MKIEISETILLSWGFRRSSGPLAYFWRRFPTGIDGSRCEMRFLPDEEGWIVEIWNWITDEIPGVRSRIAFPRLLTSLQDLSDLIRLFDPVPEYV